MSISRESPVDEPATLIDALLAEQRSLTAVSCFSRLHEQHAFPAQARFYRDLVPLHQPREGEQYAFEVDLDQCSGCKGCVTACHSLNGLEEEESWRSIGQLTGGVNGHALQQTVTTACHHCVDPGCLNGCPVLAYEKDPVTGIVRHLDDQCIGCQYCVMKCPYDVPKYSERLGIVRKCDMCSQRLGEGEAPACVQACPNEAIRITVVKQDEVAAHYRSPGTLAGAAYSSPDFTELAAEVSEFDQTNSFLPGSPAPDYTVPTTRYKTSRPPVAVLRAADEAALKPEHAHWPLVWLLVLSQASVGWIAAAFIVGLRTSWGPAVEVMTVVATVLMGVALGLATLHLGRPLKAWRVFLGWRQSWFSREAIAFGGYMNLLGLASALIFLGWPEYLKWVVPIAFLMGLVSVFCSVLLYVDTRREFWSAYHTGVRFFGTTLLLGLIGILMLQPSGSRIAVAVWVAVSVVSSLKVLLEAGVLLHGRARQWSPLKRTARLMTGPLRLAWSFRLFAQLLGGVVFPWLAIDGVVNATADYAILCGILLLVGELAERFLFFTAVSPTRMPGGIHS